MPSMVSMKKAKHEGNQQALDRLKDKYDKVTTTSTTTASKSNYGHSLNRAIKSLRECTTQVSTIEDALALKYVGPAIAKLMVPNDTTTTTTKTTTTSTTAPIQRSSPIAERHPLLTAATAAAAKVTSKRTELAQIRNNNNNNNNNKLPPTAKHENVKSIKQINHEAAVAAAQSLSLPSKDWKVTLLLDGREHRAEQVQAKLQMSGVPCEQRHLPIGDMAWIATSGTVEVMLGTIVERKEVGDFVSSLFGTRYLEQRLRLQHCGVPQVMLLVEGDVNSVNNCPADTLRMAMMETRVQLDFQVHQTKHLEDTVRFLKLIHRRILQRAFPNAFGHTVATSLPSFNSQQYQRRKKKKVSLVDMVFDSPPVPPLGQTRFVTYDELKTKVLLDREQGTRTLKAIYCGMLKQIPSLSHKKVVAIAKAYPTPTSLIQAYQGLSVEEGESLLADLDIPGDALERLSRVGPKSSLEVYHVFTQGGGSTTPSVSLTTRYSCSTAGPAAAVDASRINQPSSDSETRISTKMTHPSVPPDLGGSSAHASMERSLEGKSCALMIGYHQQQEHAFVSESIPNHPGSPTINVEKKFTQLRRSLAVLANDLKSSSTVAHPPNQDSLLTSDDDCEDILVREDDDEVAVAREYYPQSLGIVAVESSQSSAEDEPLMVRLKKRPHTSCQDVIELE